MAQTGYTPISIYYSATTTNVPTAGNLVAGELAINTADGKLFYKDSSGVVQTLATKGGVGSSSTTQVLYNSSGTIAGSANFVFDGTNVGIGTASPSSIGAGYSTLDIRGSTGGAQRWGNATNSAYIYSNSSETNLATATALPLLFSTNTVERMRLTSGGFFLVGLTNPAFIYSGSSTTTSNAISCAGYDALTLVDPVVGQPTLNFAVNNSTPALYRASSIRGFLTTTTAGSEASALSFYTVNGGSNIVEKMRLNANGNLSLYGGTTTATGVGVTFPATQSASSDANTLDDYEEGTWTVTIDSQVAGTGRTTLTKGSTYTKIGNTVVATCYANLSVLGSGGSGGMVISGLPFASSGTGGNYAAIYIGYYAGLASNYYVLGGYNNPGTSTINITGKTATSTTLDVTSFSSLAAAGFELILTIVYKTN
jgi:hypothetical protein